MRIQASAFARLSSSSLSLCDNLFTGVSYDSREIEKGWMYVAIQGSKADGHAFIPSAVGRGASVILADERKRGELEALLKGKKVSLITSKDVVTALSRYASLSALQNDHFTAVSVTGSCGKTTTKEMISSILSVRYNVCKTPGNRNSIYGLPLAVMELEKSADFGVYEMGVDHPKEMDRLVSCLPPEFAVITNIGICHLESFGERDNIAREKGKILLPQTQGFVLDDNDYIDYFKTISPSLKVVSNPFSRVEFLGLDGLRVKLGKKTFIMPTVGLHNIKDASLAIALCRHLGMSDNDIITGLENVTPLFGRSRVVKESGLTVIEDCYNATLDSVSDAIHTVSNMTWKGSRHIVLGDMKELGHRSKQAHAQVGLALCKASCEHIYLYGEEMEEAYRVMYDRGRKDNVVYTPSFRELSSSLIRETNIGDLLLLKGSRAMAMERLFEVLKEVV